jgi:homoserine kinase type II
VFETMGGEEVCQAMVDPPRARAVGALVARAHAAAQGFPRRRGGRFQRQDVRQRLEEVAALDRPELRDAVGVLRDELDGLDARRDSLPLGVIHGDLFRDNVRWEGDRVVGILDWESASDGELVFDLAVAILAWCYGEDLDRRLVDQIREGYEALRPLEPREAAAFGAALREAAVRFTVTRITDYHLRDAEQVKQKDWRRFYDRLRAVAAL